MVRKTKSSKKGPSAPKVTLIERLKRRTTKRRIKVTTIIVIVLLGIGLITGHTTYGLALIRCGRLPVSASRFMAGYSYVLPGESYYSVGPFQEYYCTQQEAQKAGFHHDPWTEGGKKEDQERRAKYNEERKFAISKLNFQFYVPNLLGYTITDMHVDMIHSNIHAFYTIVKDGKNVGQVRELKKTDNYNLCKSTNPQDSYCKVIGHDAAGREVNREYINGVKGWKSYYTSINIGDTGIILSTDNNQEALKVFGAMKLYKE